MDFLVLGFVGALAYVGWRRGTVVMAFAAGSLLLGYMGAFLLYRPLAG